jgi:hypothetical protein
MIKHSDGAAPGAGTTPSIVRPSSEDSGRFERRSVNGHGRLRRSWRGLMEDLARVGRSIQLHDLPDALHRVGFGISRLIYLREIHIWYRLNAVNDLTLRSRSSAFTIVKARQSDLGVLTREGLVRPRVARRRWTQGADLWVVFEYRRPVFACWMFRSRVPVAGARRGWIEFSPRTVAAVDSIVIPSLRSVAVAREAWFAIARNLPGESVDAIVTAIDEFDLPNRRVLEQVGFRAFGSMRVTRIGGRVRSGLSLHTRVHPDEPRGLAT